MNGDLVANEVDLTKVADLLLKTPYVKQLVREETSRQGEAWLKRRILPFLVVFTVAAAIFGWKANEFYKKVEQLETRIEGDDKRIGGVEMQIDKTSELIRDANEAATSGKQSARQAAETVLTSLGLVSKTGETVGSANALLSHVSGDIGIAQEQLKSMEQKTSDLQNDISKSSTELSKLRTDEEKIDASIQDFPRQVEAITPDIERFRVFHIQVLQTNRNENRVIFGDPDNTGVVVLTIRGLVQVNGDHRQFTGTAIIEKAKTDTASRKVCIFNQPIVLDLDSPFELDTLKPHESSRGCLPEGIKLFADATPIVYDTRSPESDQMNKYIFVRVDRSPTRPKSE